MAEILTATRFYLEFDGMQEMQIYECQGLGASTQIAGHRTIGSGRQSQGLRQATPAGRETYTDVTFKLYATNLPQVWQWYREIITNSGSASQWEGNRKAGSVSVYDQAAAMQARWEFKNCCPTKYEVASLKADGQDLLLETLVMTYEDMERVM
jgi:phage tail-like protein